MAGKAAPARILLPPDPRSPENGRLRRKGRRLAGDGSVRCKSPCPCGFGIRKSGFGRLRDEIPGPVRIRAFGDGSQACFPLARSLQETAIGLRRGGGGTAGASAPERRRSASDMPRSAVRYAIAGRTAKHLPESEKSSLRRNLRTLQQTLYQAVEKPLGQAKWGFGKQAAAPIPQSARYLSSASLRFSHRLAR